MLEFIAVGREYSIKNRRTREAVRESAVEAVAIDVLGWVTGNFACCVHIRNFLCFSIT